MGEPGGGPRADVRVQNAQISMLVDSGSPINIIDVVTFGKLVPKPNLESCSTEFFHAFMSDTKLPLRGKFQTQIHYKAISITAYFYVVDGFSELLLSSRNSENLGLISFDSKANRKPATTN